MAELSFGGMVAGCEDVFTDHPSQGVEEVDFFQTEGMDGVQYLASVLLQERS